MKLLVCTIGFISLLISIDNEWPPQDGEYMVTNMPECPAMDSTTGNWFYDGYGFYREKGRYVMAQYWRAVPEKRYGKVTT